MKMYDTIAAYAATKNPEEIRKEFETAMKQLETERKAKAAADAKAKYASRLTEIANHMLNHTETEEDIAFILNTYFTDKLGPQENDAPYLSADGIKSILKPVSIIKEFATAPAATRPRAHSDDEAISKFLNDILGL